VVGYRGGFPFLMGIARWPRWLDATNLMLIDLLAQTAAHPGLAQFVARQWMPAPHARAKSFCARR
jgi:hypothetical protein